MLHRCSLSPQIVKRRKYPFLLLQKSFGIYGAGISRVLPGYRVLILFADTKEQASLLHIRANPHSNLRQSQQRHGECVFFPYQIYTNFNVPHVLVMVSIVVIKHQEQKQHVDERVYLSLQLSHHTLPVK